MRAPSFRVFFVFTHMATSGLKTVKLIRNKSCWTLTRFSDDLFVAKNSWGKKHVFRSGAEMTHFEDFLLDAGFAEIERGRSLSTLKRVEPAEQDEQPEV